MAEQKIFAGPRIRRIRNQLQLTQTAMAVDLGISPSYLNLIERNQRPPQSFDRLVGRGRQGVAPRQEARCLSLDLNQPESISERCRGFGVFNRSSDIAAASEGLRHRANEGGCRWGNSGG